MPLLDRLPRIDSAVQCFCAAWGIALCLSACAQLPQEVPRPVSVALDAQAGTPLAALVKQRRDAAGARFDSGFLLLDGAPAAYGSRLALVQRAQKTLDLQYYSIHADASTARLLVGVRDAARRGVRVRILLDDLHSTGRDALVMSLAFEPNIEMRMFNPLAGARDSSLGRLVNSVDDAARIQQRMHNKLFIADNVLAVTGGRNLGDAYFGIARDANFIDLDVLVAGPVVQDLSRSFDAYWNNERAYPVESLVKREELERIRERARTAEQDRPSVAETTHPDAGPAASAARSLAWDEKPMDLGTITFTWAPAVVLVDKPGKIPADTPHATMTERRKSAGLVVARKHGRAGVAQAGNTPLEAAADAAAEGDTVIEGLVQLIGLARHDLLIISPYFVPGPEMMQAFAAARSRGVRIRVLTNSLASNDAPVAHVGYARHREALLSMGIELHELRSAPVKTRDAIGSAGGSEGGSVSGASRSMLHSKVIVMDGQLLVVGSMNLDLRSQLHNTEIALLIRSNELSRIAAGKIDTVLREGAWHVELADGHMVWHAPADSGVKDATAEPDASPGLRLLLEVLRPLAPDKLL